MEQSNQTTPAPWRHRRRVPLVVALAIGLLVIPAIALANHQFSDVATGASFHDDVEVLVGAGITTGCGGGKFCPGNPVTRGQMAQFMNRGLGIATSAFSQVLIPGPVDETLVAIIEIPAGPQPGGTGFVTVSSDLTATMTIDDVCPCAVQFIVINLATKGDVSPIGSFVMADDAVTGTRASGSTLSWVFEVPTGEQAAFGLIAILIPGAPVPIAAGGFETQGASLPTFTGTMTAEYSPFGFEQPEPILVTVEPDGTVEGPFGPMSIEEFTR